MTTTTDDAIEIIRGDDEAIAITIKDESDVSQLLAGNVIFLTVKEKINDTDANAIFAEEYNVLANTEEFVIDLSHTETELPLGTYFCDLQWKNNSNKIKTIFKGQFLVAWDVTRRIV